MYPNSRNSIHRPALLATASLVAAWLTVASTGPAFAFPDEWDDQVEVSLEREMKVSRADARKSKDATAIVEVTIAGDGSVKDYKLTQSSGSSFLDVHTKHAIHEANTFPAYSDDQNMTRTVSIKMSYDKIKMRSDRDLRRAFYKKNGRYPSPKDAVVAVDAEVLPS